MRNFYVLLIITVLFVTLSCINNSTIEVSQKNLYNQKSIELITQIMDSEEAFCDCIVQIQDESIFESIDFEEFRVEAEKAMIKAFEIDNRTELIQLDSLGAGFKITPKSFNNKFTIVELNEIPSQFESIETDKAKLFYKKCPNGACFFSRPIFNKDFTKALINLDSGFSCIPMPSRFYFYFRGDWEVSGHNPHIF